MHAGLRKAVITVALCAGCGAAIGQAQEKAQLEQRIHEGESAVSSAEGSRDGVAWLRLAILYQDEARYGDAEGAFRKAMELLKVRSGGVYAEALDRMGTMYVEQGMFAKAEPLEQRALTIRQDAHDAIGTGRSYTHLALIAYGKYDLRGAETDAEMAVSLLAPEHAENTRTAQATPEEKMSALIDLSLIRCAQNECGAAAHDLQRALELAKANYTSNSVPVGFLHFLLGYAQTKNGEVQGGTALMKTGIGEMKTQMGWGHPTYVAALMEYRSVLVKAGRDEEAEAVGESLTKLESSSARAKRGVGLGVLGVNALR